MSLTVTGTLSDLIGTAYNGASITVRNVSFNASNNNGVILQRSVEVTTDENGDFSVTLETPSDADESFLTEWTLPDGQSFCYEASTGSDTTLINVWQNAVAG